MPSQLQHCGRWVWSTSGSSCPGSPGVSLEVRWESPVQAVPLFSWGCSSSVWVTALDSISAQGMPICLSLLCHHPDFIKGLCPGPASEAAHGEGALTWLPAPATVFPFHTKELFLHLWVKSFFGAMISPCSLWFRDISVQQSPPAVCINDCGHCSRVGEALCVVALPGGPAGLSSAWPQQLWVSLVNHCFAFGN